MAKVKLVAASALVLMVASACSSGSGSGPSSTAAGSASAAAPDGAVTSYQDAQKAVIQIVADGEYVDIASGESVQSSGSGSGFIIDPSGIAVTNAHVVEGAGSVAKNNASGDTSWASLDYSLQDTAPIQSGNCGGPLLMEDGSGVGINYMAADVTNTTQFFAIPQAIAAPVVEVLRTGKDQDSIGINGEAFYGESSSLAGVWVSGVRSGSPASNAGVLPGDVIVQMEGRDVVKEADLSRFGPT